MRLLFTAAELAPLVRVGGLAEAAGGLVAALRRGGVDVTVVIPDYGDVVLGNESRRSLNVPSWAGPMTVRSGIHPVAGEVTLLGNQALARSHPYVDPTGIAWSDNDKRFLAFSAGIAALRDDLAPDVVHLNDWHTAAATALGGSSVPTVLTIHTLAYQGVSPASWMSRLTHDAAAFEWYEQTNPLAGGITLSDRVVAVSPNYSREILQDESGMGLHELLRAKGPALVGILNGIDTDEWNPEADPHIVTPYSSDTIELRRECRRALLDLAGWEDSKAPVIGVVSRLVDQKGIDLLIAAIPFLDNMPARLLVLGSGLPEPTAALRSAAAANPSRVHFTDGYDLALAHRIFAGADLFAMPSRFEPCGLAQMQAMRYGSIPIVSPVGGLVDTVVDADASRLGTGFIAKSVTTAGLVDAVHRAVRAFKSPRRRAAIQRRGMAQDWSWDDPAKQHIDLYHDLTP